VSLVVPLHRELKRGTLAGILRDAGIDREELRRLLRPPVARAEGSAPQWQETRLKCSA
jgi:hypothetical protein